MHFDSHVSDLLDVAARLVNLMTGDLAGGRPWQPPEGAHLTDACAEILQREGVQPRVTPNDLETLQRFARGARPVFDAVDDDRALDAAQAVNALLRWTRPRPQLDDLAEGWSLHFHGPSDDLGPGWAAGCAMVLAMAVGSRSAGRLGVCDAERCERVYVDQSKNGTRRFCGLACQNRMKNAEHRRRARG